MGLADLITQKENRRKAEAIREQKEYYERMTRKEAELDTGTASKLRQLDNEIRQRRGLPAR